MQTDPVKTPPTDDQEMGEAMPEYRPLTEEELRNLINEMTLKKLEEQELLRN